MSNVKTIKYNKVSGGSFWITISEEFAMDDDILHSGINNMSECKLSFGNSPIGKTVCKLSFDRSVW